MLRSSIISLSSVGAGGGEPPEVAMARVVHKVPASVDLAHIQGLLRQKKKMEAIKAYKSQFHDPSSNEPITYISTGGFLENVEARSALLGKRIGVAYAEGFICENIPGIANLDSLLLPKLA